VLLAIIPLLISLLLVKTVRGRYNKSVQEVEEMKLNNKFRRIIASILAILIVFSIVVSIALMGIN
jgi:hypothetical protein